MRCRPYAGRVVIRVMLAALSYEFDDDNSVMNLHVLYTFFPDFKDLSLLL